MICYAIKNELGHYRKTQTIQLGNSDEDYGEYEDINWVDLFEATFYDDYNYAKCMCQSQCNSCKVVKVEIREVKDE